MTMFKTLTLVLPVLIPSWRFFKTIAPSPRVQWVLLPTADSPPTDWQDYRPRPQSLSLARMLGRVFWNPAWNTALFVVSCAEKLQQDPSDFVIDEIRQRILSDLDQGAVRTGDTWLQFRLVFVHRDATGLCQEVLFVSRPHHVAPA